MAFLIVFASIEVAGHLFFGSNAYFHYRKVGKTTIYYPGNLTAFLGFTPAAIWGLHTFISEGLLTGGQWGQIAQWMIGFIIIWLGLPSVLLARKNSPFTYSTPPVEGYYLHKYQVALENEEQA